MNSSDPHQAETLRRQLSSEPYTTLRVWQDGLAFAGPGYLDSLDETMLTSIKASLDHAMQTGTVSTLGTHYQDDFFPREALAAERTLAVDVFRRATGQLLAEPVELTCAAVLTRAQALLQASETPGVDPASTLEKIREFLHLQTGHMTHFRYSWSDMKADPAIFQTFIRDALV